MSPPIPNAPKTTPNIGANDLDNEVSELLDWDFCIDTAPMRPSGVVEADVEFVGRGRPIPLDDPHVRNAS